MTLPEIRTVTCSRCREKVTGHEGRHYLTCDNTSNALFRQFEGILCAGCIANHEDVEVSGGAEEVLRKTKLIPEEVEDAIALASIDEEEAPDSSEEGEGEGEGKSEPEAGTGVDNTKPE